MGEKLLAFERALSEYLGGPEVIAVTNGTAGLHLAMISAGVGPGDEVITTPLSFIASTNVILYQGAVPVFVDVCDDFNLDPEKIASTITAKTRAILVVHLFGQPVRMDEVNAIASDRSLAVIEDACQALGTELRCRKAGTLSDVGVFGFYPNKQITLAEGGAIATWDEHSAELLRILRNQGRDSRSNGLIHSHLGYNYRLDEIRAAIGEVQVSRVEELLAKRQEVSQWYKSRLKGDERIRLPNSHLSGGKISWFSYVIRLDTTILRDTVKSCLARRGIVAREYFPPIHLQPFYRSRLGYCEGAFPRAEALAASCLALPFSSVMKQDEVEYVCENLRDILDKCS